MSNKEKINNDLKKLKPFNSIIQICPICHKVDVYLNDGHDCNDEIMRQQNLAYYD